MKASDLVARFGSMTVSAAAPRMHVATSLELAQREADISGHPVRRPGWAAFADPDGALVYPSNPHPDGVHTFDDPIQHLERLARLADGRRVVAFGYPAWRAVAAAVGGGAKQLGFEAFVAWARDAWGVDDVHVTMPRRA